MAVYGTYQERALKKDIVMDSINYQTDDHDTQSSLGNFLLQDQLIEVNRLKAAIAYCDSHSLALTYYLVQVNYLTGEQILNCCINHFDLPIFYLSTIDTTAFEAELIPIAWMKRFRIVPLHYDRATLQLGVTDPTCLSVISKVRFHLGLDIKLSLVDEEALEAFFAAILPAEERESLEQLVQHVMPVAAHTTHILHHRNIEPDDEPVIKLVNQLLSDGERYRASDIHCEPHLNHYRVRFRIDGQLYERVTIPHDLARRMLSRIKLLANLDVTEKRLPQDGRMRSLEHSQLDIRVSTCPTVIGEKVVLRLFKQHQEVCHLQQLGLFEEQLQQVLEAIQKPHGLIIVTGPTGSGKTITLYAILQALKQAKVNITTIEEPVEMIIPGVNQINVNSRIGLHFAHILRAILRQDPDVIMIGEIRDAETAAIALQAASTGHLVLGTLHANHTLAALNRLQLLGLQLVDCLQTLALIVAQRLVRRLCAHCGHDLTKNDCSYQPQMKQCTGCIDGFYGRTGVFEIVVPNEHLISLFIKQMPLYEIAAHLQRKGWLSLHSAGMKKVVLGETNDVEIKRVIGYG